MAKEQTRAGFAGVLWNEAGWAIGAQTPCFLCEDPVGPVAIYWAGLSVVAVSGSARRGRRRPEAGLVRGSPVLVLHPRCAVRLAKELGEDAEREARPCSYARTA